MMLDWEHSGRPLLAGEPQTYRISFPIAVGPWECSVKGCKGRATTRMGLHVHLLHRHMWGTVIIVEEEKLPHPWFTHCDMLVLWEDLNRHHPKITQYEKEAEQKRHRLVAEDMRERTELYFWLYGHPITLVTSLN